MKSRKTLERFRQITRKHDISIHDIAKEALRFSDKAWTSVMISLSYPEYKYGIGTTWLGTILCCISVITNLYIKIIYITVSLLSHRCSYTYYVPFTVFQSFKGLFIKIRILLGNNDGYVGNLCGPFNLLVRLNAHDVLSVIHDSLISAGVITVYEQSVSVKQISRSVNYSPFWDLCKCVCVCKCDIPAAASSMVHPQHSTFPPSSFTLLGTNLLAVCCTQGLLFLTGEPWLPWWDEQRTDYLFPMIPLPSAVCASISSPNSFSHWYSLILFNQSNQWLN